MNLIANTGIQIFTVPLEINLNDNFKMYFHEWFDMEDEQLKLEVAHFFSEDEIWVSKRDIFNLLGLGLTGGRVGRMENGVFKPYKWEEIKDDFYSEGNQTLTPMDTEDGGTDCFPMTLTRFRWEKFENRWLPFPFFTLGNYDKSEFAPTNWCRCKLIPDTASICNSKKYNLLLAFDTRTKYEEESFEEEDLMETPVFSSNFDRQKDFALCNNEFSLVDFCSKSRNCEWVDEYILDLYHSTENKKITSIDDIKCKKPKMSYLAQYIYIVRYIQQLNVLPTITLFSDKNVVFGDVDLLVDMGNSRTCAILFDDHDFTKVEPLGLQNFSNPLADGKLNRPSDSFDMRLAFRKADFGVDTLRDSQQFVFPSMVRLGVEANELIHNAVNLNTGVEKITTFSSPKRYLWDNKPQRKDWEFVTLNGEKNKNRLVHVKGISEQLNADGSLNTSGEGGIDKYYSRKALMTFGLLEILAQAKMQINSYTFRHNWGEENKPRRIGRIIVTCPTAMSRVEQIALRKCAEDAAIILDRFYAGTYYEEVDEKEARKTVQVIPSVKNLLNTEERNEWIYDEATCSQFVYLYAEITKRYRNNCKEYFDFYGKMRTDLDNYSKKSLTIGSIDIGAGTTDIIIAAYKYDDAGQCTLTPVPLFWESFYLAGDDLLKNLIRKLVIEGEYAVIQKQLEKSGKGDIARLILDFFAPNNARQDVERRQIRSEFNLQVSVPVVSRFLELLNENKEEKATLTFDDIFAKNKPTDRVLDHVQKHFGFSIKNLQWHYDKNVVSKIVVSTFDTLAGKISTVLSYYSCDIVLLSGRPTSLKPLSDLFLKYYAVSPNRLITLNSYRIGTWYPFQNGKGYFKDAKSIVAVGAMIGNYAATRGGLDGFSLDLSELIKKMLPTTEYFAKAENEKPFISPQMSNAVIDASQLPLRIWTRQLDSPSYPTRPFYMLDFNEDKIKERMKSKLGLADNDKNSIVTATNNELERVRKLAPFKFNIMRESYLEDKEMLKIESVTDRNGDDIAAAYFSLQVQSMSESENYWLDSGEFANLSINH
jgi:hypothetical protein